MSLERAKTEKATLWCETCGKKTEQERTIKPVVSLWTCRDPSHPYLTREQQAYGRTISYGEYERLNFGSCSKNRPIEIQFGESQSNRFSIKRILIRLISLLITEFGKIMGISDIFDDDELIVMDRILTLLSKGADTRVVVRQPGFASFYGKIHRLANQVHAKREKQRVPDGDYLDDGVEEDDEDE